MTTKDMDTLHNDVMEVLARFVDDESALAQADLNTRLIDDLDINSVRFVDVILEFEFKYDIEIDNEAGQGITTIGDVVTTLQSLMDSDQ